MIETIGAPSVCVVDDERDDYEPILAALNEMQIACVHFDGSLSRLPRVALKGIRLVFMDLHLAGQVGKTGAAQAANVFRRIVDPNSAPILVVIWSKYAHDALEGTDTEAEFFKTTLLDDEPLYRERLIFVEMSKPSKQIRPSRAAWKAELKTHIRKELKKREGLSALWSWELMVRDAQNEVSIELTEMAVAAAGTQTLDQKLQMVLGMLARAQGEADLSVRTAPLHLATVLGQLVSDRVEHVDKSPNLKPHGPWLAASQSIAKKEGMASRINSLLLTARTASGAIPFMPGTVYLPTNKERLKRLFGIDSSAISLEFRNARRADPSAPLTQDEQDWINASQVVLLELSPTCDVAQKVRRNALLVAGVLVPGDAKVKRAESILQYPAIHLRLTVPNLPADAMLCFGCRYKVTMSPRSYPTWLRPLFRLRDLPTSAARNWHASHSARIGYVAM